MSAPSEPQLSIGQCATLACLWEAIAAKPGNVHRGADFDGLSFVDFVASAVVIGPIVERAAERGFGPTLLDAVLATRRAVDTNTNLGMLLLMVPMAMVPREMPLAAGVVRVLAGLSAEDCRLAYEAIRTARPGGMSTVGEADLAGAAPGDLVAAMRLAAGRDMIARQYANGFTEFFDEVMPALRSAVGHRWSLQDAIVRTHLQVMSRFPDSLIARTCGEETARHAAAWAGSVLDAGEPGDEGYATALADFDFWLRADGHRRNPGTTADLVAGGLFAALAGGIIQLPVRFYAV